MKFYKRLFSGRLERKIRSFRDNYLRNYDNVNLPEEIYSQHLKYYSISFCTTCMNRLFHLKHTIKKNIDHNSNYPKIEFVLVNYNSQDDLDSWVRHHLQKYIDVGLLNYYRTDEPDIFHASKAKNLAHKLAKGEILCNLDGDNFTGKNFAFYINYLINQHGENVFLHFKKEPYWGTEGRMVLTRTNFNALGGYDESLLPIGHEDHDLMNRATALGLKYINIRIENFLRYLSNTTVEKAENCGTDDYYFLESANRIQSNENIRKGILKANKEISSKFNVYKNFQNEPISI